MNLRLSRYFYGKLRTPDYSEHGVWVRLESESGRKWTLFLNPQDTTDLLLVLRRAAIVARQNPANRQVATNQQTQERNSHNG